MWMRFWLDEKGATAIEYGLIASLIAMAILSGSGSLGNALDLLWQENANKLVSGMG